MKLTSKYVLLILKIFFPFIFLNTYAQNNSISLKLIYISSSKIYLYPESPDIILRKKNLPLENIWGIGIEYQKLFNESKYGLGLNVEYIRKTIDFENFNTTDGYWALPVELTGYFFIPLGFEKWKIFMGGGGGAYFGNRILQKENIIQDNIKLIPGFGIHVLGGFEYYIINNLAIKLQMKFRDLFFQTKSLFLSDPSDMQNVTLREYDSKINIDGMILEFGILFSF